MKPLAFASKDWNAGHCHTYAILAALEGEEKEEVGAHAGSTVVDYPCTRVGNRTFAARYAIWNSPLRAACDATGFLSHAVLSI